jgi:hypothetical protein
LVTVVLLLQHLVLHLVFATLPQVLVAQQLVTAIPLLFMDVIAPLLVIKTPPLADAIP